MSTPNRSNASSASSSRSRPTPVIPKATSSAKSSTSSLNGPPGQPLTVDSDSSGGRRHTPSSVARTKFTPQSSAADVAAMQTLKQKMTFSNQSSRTNSADNTPEKNPDSVSKSKSMHTPSSGARFVSTGDQSYSDNASEGEITSSVSINAILSKLDSLKGYMKEAETLHEMLQQKTSEPGVAPQLEKLNKLIIELRQQESSYIAVLLQLMDRDNGDYSQSDDYSEDDSEDEESEEEDTPVNQSSRRRVNEGGPDESTAPGDGDQALSLRAQMDEQKHLDEVEELAVLMEQQKMLKQLLDQQKQIKELEAKQASLLRMKQSAQQQILEAETKSTELLRLKREAERLQQEKQMKESSAASDQLETAMKDLELSEPGTEEFDPVEEERKQQLMSQLTELKARKEQLDQMMSVLSAIRAEEEEERNLQPSMDDKDEEVVEKPLPKLEPASQPRLSKTPPRSAIVQGTSYNAAELVAEDDSVTGMEQLQAKLRMAEEARKKLTELRTMIGQLQESDRDDESERMNKSGDHEKLAWRHSLEPTQHSGHDIKSPSKNGEGLGDTSLNSTLTATESPATQSTIDEYQRKLLLKKQEMIDLQRERDELQKTRDRLLKHYQSLGLSEGEEEEEEGEVETEVERQKLLYDELVKKTRELQQLRMLNADTQRAAKQSGPYSSADVTGATWGGSTVQSELDDADTTVSTVSGHILDTTQDSVEPAAIGGSASLEQLGGTAGEKPKFSVTRHTPRQPARTRPHVRVDISPADEQMGKRIKLDDEPATKDTSDVRRKKESTQNAKPSTISAVWPGVIFPSYYRKSSKENQDHRDESTQTHVRPTTIAGQPQAGFRPSSDRETHHTYMLQSQLAVMSNMCGELLHAQNGLIHVMCNRMESGVQEHMAMLQQYQRELEQYYLELYQSYVQITQHKDDSEQVVEGSDTEDPVTATTTGGGAGADGSATNKPSVSVPTAQEEPNIPTASEENELPTAEQERIPTLESYYRPIPPPPTLYGRPNYPPYGGGRPMTPRNYNFGLGSSAPWSQSREPPFGGPGFGFGGPGYPYYDGGARPYEPGIYQPPGSVKDDTDNPLDSSIPPPPVPPTLGTSYYQSPFNYRPSTAPGAKGGAPWNSPLRYPPVCPPSGSYYLQGSPFGGYGARPYTTPMGFTPYLDHSAHNPAASFLGHPPHPHLDSYPPFGAVPYPQMSMDASQVHSDLPAQATEDPRLRFDPSLGLRSPSGITATSLQVQPPSSPPSAQSVNLQPSSSSNLKNGSTDNTHGAGASLATGVGQTRLPQTTKTTQTGGGGYWNYSSLAPYFPKSMTGGVSEKKQDEEVKSKLRQSHQDEESESSIPLSIPDEMGTQTMGGGRFPVPAAVGGGGQSTDPPADFSVFDALRDTIYSEVATLIANNEARPHFLVELFRELQMLTTDYLRQRALYSMQELVTKYLTEEGVAKEAKASTLQFQNWVGSASEHTPSESGATTEDEVLKQLMPPSSTSNVNPGFDYAEPINSASSISTPQVGSSMLDDPFASDNLGNTVIKMDKAMMRVRAQHLQSAQSPSAVSPGALGGDLVSESSQSDTAYPDLDTQLLDEEIKAIMTEVIPILKKNLDEDFTAEYLTQIKDIVMTMITEQQKSQKRDLFEMFVKQLDAAISSTLEKYLNQKLKDCGEDLLVETSEVLFNELAFFRLMQDIKGHPQLVADFKSMTSQTTTENDEEEEESNDDSDRDETTAVRTSVRVGTSAPTVTTSNSNGTQQQPLDPVVLQVLGAVANVTLMEEEEALGKSRDDDLATSWDTKVRESSMSADEETGGVNKGVMESQPVGLTVTGGHVSDSKEPTPVPVEQQSSPDTPAPDVQVPKSSSTEETTEARQDSFREEERIATPPTPLAVEPSDTGAANTVEDEGDKQEVGVAEKIKDGGDSIDDQQVGQVLSSSGGASVTDVVVPTITMTQEALDAQMKVEQQANDGVTGILANIEDLGQELAGGGDDIASLDSAEP